MGDFMKLLVATSLLVFAASCSTAGGGGVTTSGELNVNAPVTGGVSQSVVGGGTGGAGGTATNTLALDPAVFADLFGAVANIVHPNAAQLAKVKEKEPELTAEQKAALAGCQANPNSCTIIKN